MHFSRHPELLSLHMPDDVKFVAASPHTLRMLSNTTCFDRETERKLIEDGIAGYLWGKTFIHADDLPHSVYRYVCEVGSKTLDLSGEEPAVTE